jgi:hypothetical protein
LKKERGKCPGSLLLQRLVFSSLTLQTRAAAPTTPFQISAYFLLDLPISISLGLFILLLFPFLPVKRVHQINKGHQPFAHFTLSKPASFTSTSFSQHGELQ